MEYVRRRFRVAVAALEHLVGGLGTAVLALGTLLGTLVVAAACVGGVGLLLVPGLLQAVRSVA
ncbi:histidine kinase, partial [Micromonospora chalcea]